MRNAACILQRVGWQRSMHYQLTIELRGEEIDAAETAVSMRSSTWSSCVCVSVCAELWARSSRALLVARCGVASADARLLKDEASAAAIRVCAQSDVDSMAWTPGGLKGGP